MSHRMSTALGAGAAALALIMTTSLVQAAGAERSLATPAATAEDAVAQAFQTGRVVYHGDCASTTSPNDLGAICSTFVAQRGATRAYLAGAAFAEYGEWVFVRQDAGGWLLTGTAPFDGGNPARAVPWPAL